MDESFTCPRCGMTSHNPNDVREGYCGNCHDWTAMNELITILAQDLSDQIIIQPTGLTTEPYVRMARKLLRDGWFKINDETNPAVIAQFLINNLTAEQIYAIRAALSAGA